MANENNPSGPCYKWSLARGNTTLSVLELDIYLLLLNACESALKSRLTPYVSMNLIAQGLNPTFVTDEQRAEIDRALTSLIGNGLITQSLQGPVTRSIARSVGIVMESNSSLVATTAVTENWECDPDQIGLPNRHKELLKALQDLWVDTELSVDLDSLRNKAGNTTTNTRIHDKEKLGDLCDSGCVIPHGTDPNLTYEPLRKN